MLEKHYLEGILEAGCDEAGRGCLAGPVFASAVILPPDFSHPLLKDSKQLSEKWRYFFRDIIIRKAISYAVAMASNEEIDDLNILNASILAMHRALDKLDPVPQHIIIDGNHFAPYFKIPFKTIVKGDNKYRSIAAASILAKTFRDDFMIGLHKKFPRYGWNRNKGYPTKKHREAILHCGISPLHRKSFTLLPLQYEINYT